MSPSDACTTGARAYLDEPDRSGFFTETLTAEVEAIFTNEACLVRAEAAGDTVTDVGRGTVWLYLDRGEYGKV